MIIIKHILDVKKIKKQKFVESFIDFVSLNRYNNF